MDKSTFSDVAAHIFQWYFIGYIFLLSYFLLNTHTNTRAHTRALAIHKRVFEKALNYVS